MNISILNGRLIDPANGIDDILNLHIQGQQILAIGTAPDGFEAQEAIDASGCIVCPGLVDISASLRDPGPGRIDLASETAATARGGITTLVCTCLLYTSDAADDT